MSKKQHKPKKVLSPQEEQELGPMLKQAEAIAKAGFTSQPQEKFDLAADMQAQQQAFDSQIPLDQMQQQAMDTVGLNPMMSEADPTDIPPTEESTENKKEEDNWIDSSEPPIDSTQRLHWTAKRLLEFSPKAPNVNVLEQWKQIHGGVYVLNVGDHIFIYRYLKLAEWRLIQVKPEWPNLTPEQRNRMMVVKCLLWPRFDSVTEAGLPAGAIDMLAEQIQMQSMFLNPQSVANMTLKL
jgi:hypothetical protein